jgi:hypothetical protein
MKKNYLKMFIALIVAATFSFYQMQAQTTGSGTMTNNCIPAANLGTSGAGSMSIGCGAGNATMSGVYNTSVGESAGNALSTGPNNSFFGFKSGF